MEASIYRLRHRDILALCVLSLLAIGAIMVQSASSSITGDTKWQWSAMGAKHLRFVIASAATFLFIGRFDYSWLARRRSSIWTSPILWALLTAILLCTAVLVPGVGVQINGARRWIRLGPVQLQPSELAKWAVVLFLAYWLTFKPVGDRFFRGFIPTVAPVGVLCLLVVIKDFGTAALIAACAFTMLLAGRVRIRHLLIILLPVLLGGAWFIFHKSYRMDRLLAYRDPWASPQGKGYHMIQSLLSFSSGGLFGRGLGNGIQKLGYLPEDTTDFIFSIVCEELGLFGAMLTIALYMGVLFVAWQVVKQNRDNFGKMLAFGTASMLGLQAAINVAVATVSVPTKGLSLPLVSAGGTGLVITCAALGLLYSVTRFAHLPEVVEPQEDLTPQFESIGHASPLPPRRQAA